MHTRPPDRSGRWGARYGGGGRVGVSTPARAARAEEVEPTKPTASAPPRAAISRLPDTPGVYRFRDGRNRVLYIGRAVNLRRRVASYWSDLRDRAHLSTMVGRIARIEAVSCASEHEAAWLERNLLEAHLPAANRTRGGQEVPVHLRLDPGPETPGLRVVHHPGPASQVRHFGPYLGGTRVRLAASALHRVLPLAYAGTGITGLDLDLAGKLGIDPSHRARLVDALVAVLSREPAAVRDARDRLCQRRDDAAGRLAFELAGRLQAEIEAVEWITCTQRVTLARPDDLDAYGWADDLLVRFQVRAGRLCGWSQRSCTLERARRYLDATPPDWAEFAGGTAELAARLAR
ncbi:hypothetical protein C6W10_35935 [Plantactinospora sp. BB1]|nr:hypothetical protein C6W10_35935 [Plantactinospora sp. BB1]